MERLRETTNQQLGFDWGPFVVSDHGRRLQREEA